VRRKGGIVPYLCSLTSVLLRTRVSTSVWAFLLKLIALLSVNKLDPKFNVIVFLTAHDPEREVRDQVRSEFRKRGVEL
jgi:sister chromatid cohesion protein PDS5